MNLLASLHHDVATDIASLYNEAVMQALAGKLGPPGLVQVITKPLFSDYLHCVSELVHVFPMKLFVGVSCSDVPSLAQSCKLGLFRPGQAEPQVLTQQQLWPSPR